MALLMVFRVMIGMLMHAVVAVAAPSASSGSCLSGSISCWLSSNAQIFKHIAENLIPVEHLITGLAYLMGIFFMIKAILGLKHFGESRMGGQTSGLKEPLLFFIIASVFIYFPTAFSVIMNTTFGYSSVLAYSSVNSSSEAIDALFGSGNSIGQSLAIIIQVIGLVSFFRGWLMISKGSQGQTPGGISKGIVHIIGGIMCMNIIGTLQMLNNTLYG